MVGLNDYVHLVTNLAQGFSVMIIETKVHILFSYDSFVEESRVVR
ncbi:MAG: hypothetical protein [Olavius algarvensis Gamma 1 endosymbiont]|nr:MAG: hypothetical protein [Olavius algarvensis Gamma 1 endosymbiont]